MASTGLLGAKVCISSERVQTLGSQGKITLDVSITIPFNQIWTKSII